VSSGFNATNTSVGGYYTFNNETSLPGYKNETNRSYPYYYQTITDRMVNTSNCLQCHNNTDATSRFIWGNVSYNPSEHYTTYTSSECHNCHVQGGGTPLNFHDQRLVTGGGPDCTACHDIGKNFVNVNVSSMNNTNVAHRMLNNRSGDPGVNDTTGDWNNRRCWACHGNGSKLSDQHPANFKTPWNCQDCHVVNSSFNGSQVNKYVYAPNVTEHIQWPYYEEVCTNGTRSNNENSTGNGTCVTCHNNSIGVTNGSQFKSLTNTLLANVSHYARNDSLPAPNINTTNCLYCHNSTANGSKWGNATFLDLPGGHNNANSNGECYGCHGGVPPSFHNESMGPGAGTCRECHFSWSIMSPAVRQYAFVNETDYNQSVHGNPSVINCTDCHTNTSDGTKNHTGSNYYPPQSGLKWCEDCHVVNQSITDPASHNITSKPQNYNVTYQGQSMSVLNVTDCTACHDTTLYETARATFNRSSGKDCRFCHTFPDREPESYY
jgi:nitrate/TMAO reductase-like tetraheme cytochrome c subunit